MSADRWFASMYGGVAGSGDWLHYGNDAGGSPCCRSKAGRLREQSGGQLVDIGIGDPASALYVESEKIGVQLLSLCNEVLHVHRAQISAKEAHCVKEGGECQNQLRLR